MKSTPLGRLAHYYLFWYLHQSYIYSENTVLIPDSKYYSYFSKLGHVRTNVKMVSYAVDESTYVSMHMIFYEVVLFRYRV